MGEKLLKALLQLFALVAKVDGVKVEERHVIEDFLREQINEDAVEGYIGVFDEYAAKDIKTSDQTKMLKICTQVNHELTQTQKVIILFRVLELILADKHISSAEDDFIRTVANTLNLDAKLYDELKDFVQEEDLYKLPFDNLLIINERNQEPTIGSKYLNWENFPGELGIYKIPDGEMYIVKYLGDWELFFNGNPMKSGRLYFFSRGSSIRSGKSNPIYYSDVVAMFLKDGQEAQISLEASGIEFVFPGNKIGLKDVNIGEFSGRLIGIMGASGSGKSTLMNVLNGTFPPSRGTVTINGIDIYKDRDKVEGIFGYVPQDDLLIEDLTVYQNLYYAAKLCFSKYKNSEMHTLVMDTLLRLGLVETKDLKVGSPLKKTISGGQRKRLNIGLELLREPAILFIDEPTSGLSSRDSENIMDLLKELSLRGKLIFTVIHQPSSDIFKMFDKLFILDLGGLPIYYGNPVEALIYFKKITQQVNSDQGECKECGNVNPEQIFNIVEMKVVDEYGTETEKRKILPNNWFQHYKENEKLEEIHKYESRPEGTLDKPSRFGQFLVFLKRDFFSKISNKQYVIINLLEAPFLAFVLAFIVKYYNIDPSLGSTGYIFSKNVNIPAYLFMAVIVSLFMGLTVSAEEIIRDQKILKREQFLKLSRGSYLYSKVFLLFGLSAIQAGLFVVVGNQILEIQGLGFEYWLILFSASCFSNLLGLNISSAFNSAVTVYILIPIILIPQLLLGGVLVKFDEINPRLAALGKVPLFGDVMISRWAFEAFAVAQFKDNSFEKQFYNFDRVRANSEYKTTYWIPKLRTKLDFNIQFSSSGDDNTQNQILYNSKLILDELKKEERNNKFIDLGDIASMEAQKLSPRDYNMIKTFLVYLEKYFAKVYTNATYKKDQKVIQLTDNPEKREAFLNLKNKSKNDQLELLVTNRAKAERILEYKGKLIQLLNPIYKNPEIPKVPFDFRTHFYAPQKYFFGKFYPTKYFNVAMIWAMSIILFIALYFDWLRKLMTFSERLSRSKEYRA
jgi:ABC-type multidrug transport system ATPase subunit/uncharacterized tellurite resistance protein B-like protein